MMPLSQVNLERTLPPLRWSVGGLILQGYINTIASLPGEGKTALLTGLAWQASRTKGTFLNRHVAHGTTLYVDFDAPGDGRTVRYWLDKHKHAFDDGDIGKIVVLEPDLNTYGLAKGELQELTEVAKRNRSKAHPHRLVQLGFPQRRPHQARTGPKPSLVPAPFGKRDRGGRGHHRPLTQTRLG